MTMLPLARQQTATSSQTWRASRRPIPPLLGSGVLAGPDGQCPLSRTSACAAAPATFSSSYATGDPYRTAFVAISLTAIMKSAALRCGRPACAAHSATTRRICRKSPTVNRTAYGAAAHGVPACPDDAATCFPYHRGRPRNRAGHKP